MTRYKNILDARSKISSRIAFTTDEETLRDKEEDSYAVYLQEMESEKTLFSEKKMALQQKLKLSDDEMKTLAKLGV